MDYELPTGYVRGKTHYNPSKYLGPLPEPNSDNCDYDCHSYNYGEIRHNMQNHRLEMEYNRERYSEARNRGK